MNERVLFFEYITLQAVGTSIQFSMLNIDLKELATKVNILLQNFALFAALSGCWEEN
jgi:hypothetical protein